MLILLGLMLVGVAVWLTLTPRQVEPAAAQNSGPVRADPGYSALDASVVETGADGLPLYTLQAHTLQQQADTNIIDLSTVHMTFRDSDGGQWEAHSETAQARQDAAEIDLTGSVEVSGKFASSDQPLSLLTQTLHVDTKSQIVRTRAPYTLNWGGQVLTARGLVADLKEQRLKLESQVHGRFAR